MNLVGIYKRHDKRTLVARLGEELGVPVFGKTFGVLPQTPGFIYNFGCSVPFPLPFKYKWLNPPCYIKNAALKDSCLEILSAANVPTVEWTTSRNVARSWTDLVYCRTLISVSQGRGIEFWCQKDGEIPLSLPDAPLYTKEYKKTHEFRIHVHHRLGAFATVIKLPTKKQPDMQIRSHKRGWDLVHFPGEIYQRYNHDSAMHRIERMAVDAVKACNLHIGAVDILAKFKGYDYIDAVVCEVNTAPAIRHTTRPAYIKLFKGELGEL